ncbi:MAG: glycosyltransferase family 4 protein [Burkholderiaceae bacterium]|nr:glycosyltransferase family 4 protein [Burkholderiaceae bacterium]
MIVIVYPQFYGVGGIARYLDSFLSNLPADAPEMVLITGDAVAGAKTYPNVELIHLPMGKSRLGLAWWSWKARRCIETLQRRAPVTAVNLHVPPLIPGLFMSRKFPIMLTAHSTYLGMSSSFDGKRNFRGLWGALSLWLKVRMERTIIARADMVISLTQDGREQLARYGRQDRIAIVPNGVDLAQFTSASGDVKDIDLLFCGRIERAKGSRAMVEVCRQLIAENSQVRIVIVGYGADEDHVRQQLGAFPDNVVLTGKVPFSDMVGYYRRSKVYASTSYYEGLPGTCLEAMAVGLPVVVWNLPFYRDLVKVNVTGLVAETNHHQRMVSGILQLLTDPARAYDMGQRARVHVHERYDWRRLSRQLLNVHDALVQPMPSTVQVAQ